MVPFMKLRITRKVSNKCLLAVYQQWGIFLWHCSCKSWSLFAVNLKIGIIQKLIIFFWGIFHNCVLSINCELWGYTKKSFFFCSKLIFLILWLWMKWYGKIDCHTFEALYQGNIALTLIFTNFLIGFIVRMVKLDSPSSFERSSNSVFNSALIFLLNKLYPTWIYAHF
jgi:hypothetical protein